MSAFDTLSKINVNDKTEKKNGLTYLSWAWAWSEVKKVYPGATYTIYKNENGLPYAYDPNTGYMVYTTVTIDGLTHEMWLPVMDSANKAMKAQPYTIKNKYGKTYDVEAATMFDVNKAVMRCLTKNLAMHGLGFYIYAGEDLPDTVDETKPDADSTKVDPQNEKKVDPQEEKVRKDTLYKLDYKIIQLANLRGVDVDAANASIRKKLKVEGNYDDLSLDRLNEVFDTICKWIDKAKENEDTSEN